MKNIGLIIFSIIIFTSCSEDFLEVRPVGRVLEANYYQNEEQAYESLVSVYDVLQWTDQEGFTMYRPLLDAASDDTHAGGSAASDQPSWVAWDEFHATPDLGPQKGFWKKYYRGIYRANLFLEKVETIPDLSTSFKTRTVAEAKFLRAKFYFDLIRLFGRIPLITNTLVPDDYYTTNQADGSEVFPQIEQDLNDAISGLPTTVSGNELGRVTKGAAQGLLGRVLLFQNDDSKMGTAASVLQDVINSGLYSLEPNFGDIFKLSHEFGSESVFEIVYSENSIADWGRFGSGYSEGNVGVQFVGMRDYSGSTYAPGWGFCPVSLDLEQAMANDPRYEHTIIDAQALGASYAEGYQNTDFFVRKYAPLSANTAGDGDIALNWGNNIREIRYADILLMAAEALNRSGGDDATARGYVNEVRTRVGLADINTSGGDLLDDIYEERRMELACEGHRFYDLIRTNRAASILSSKGFVAGTHEVLPIPQSELDLSEGSLTQNNGY